MEEKKAILFVDDEMSILRSLKRAFLDSGYQLYFADSGAKGLAVLKAKDIDLVVSDMRMPQMDGYEFLSQVKKKYPQVVRLILSGFTQEETVYKALIDGSAKMYVAKPWDNQKLKSLVRQLLEIKEVLQNRHLLKVVNTIDKLPTLPSIYHEIMGLIEQDADFNKIVAVVEKDPAITAKVLQVANSAYFRSSTASLKRAAVFIGLMNLKDIVLGCSVLEPVAISALNPCGNTICAVMGWFTTFTNGFMMKKLTRPAGLPDFCMIWASWWYCDISPSSLRKLWFAASRLRIWDCWQPKKR